MSAIGQRFRRLHTRNTNGGIALLRFCRTKDFTTHCLNQLAHYFNGDTFAIDDEDASDPAITPI